MPCTVVHHLRSQMPAGERETFSAAPRVGAAAARPLPSPYAANLRTMIMDFGGFDSSIVLILRGGTLMPVWVEVKPFLARGVPCSMLQGGATRERLFSHHAAVTSVATSSARKAYQIYIYIYIYMYTERERERLSIGLTHVKHELD